ncbi:retinol-binding protein 2-like [Gigantopelta aegis]|uniref:retinol-binding protein 2-like n=1 Tax=Gigantopelta aegis TaxID=1735272 RepID=UPI001B88CE6D|nr:retinol-binding protein 2-like [Gigantopelta aegis]
MDNYVGRWELMPEQTTGFDEFSDALGTPKEGREAFRNLVYILEYAREGDKWTATAEIKGQGHPRTYVWSPGVEFEYEGLDGSKMKSTISWDGSVCHEKHAQVNGGEWTSTRRLEGDVIVLSSICKGKEMVQKFKRI